MRVAQRHGGQTPELLDIPCIYAAAGPDVSGNLVELLLAEQEDGAFIVYHAMRLTRKMARELEL